jgi:Leucine-rich repeat (LRR) protein
VKSLSVGRVSNLFSLSADFPFAQLDELSIEDDRLTDDDLHYFSSTVKKLDLSSEAISDLSTTTFPLLKDLTLTQCHQLKSIPPCLTQLESLRIMDCFSFSLEHSFFPFLTFLSLEFCSNITELNFLQFPSLREVLINSCDGITSLTVENPPSNDCSKSLYKMSFLGCSGLSELKMNRNIGYLTIEDCFSLARITVSDPFRVYSLKINNGKNQLVRNPVSQQEYQFPSISGTVNLQQLVWEKQEEEIQFGI